MKTCPHGHLWTEENTKYAKRPDGHTFKRCRACHAGRMRLRYRNDDAFREREKARNLARYYANKDAHLSRCSPEGVSG